MKEILKNFLLVSLPTFLLLFGLIEGYFRILEPHIDLMQWTGKEKTNLMSKWAKESCYSCYTGKPGHYSTNKSVNSHGFISTPEIDLKKPADTTRIVFLGGSSTAGTGHNIPDQKTWPWSVVERLKEANYKKVDFINAALGGYTTFESYGRLWSRLRFYDPDILVLYHGWNDMYYFDEGGRNVPANWREGFSIDKKVKTRIYEPHWIDPFVAWSQFFTRIRLNLVETDPEGETVPKKKKDRALKDHFEKSSLNVFEENLQLIKMLAKKEGYELFVCKQATLITPEMGPSDRKRSDIEKHGFDHKTHLAAFDSVYRVIEKNFSPHSIIDITSLSGKSELFNDHIHPNVNGAERISKIVADTLINNYFNAN